MMATADLKQCECIVRPAKSLQEAHDLWWPLMQELGWVRLSNCFHSCY